MRIVWDEPKRLTNLANRGLDFAHLDLEFFVASTVVVAKNERLMAIGPSHGVLLAVVFKYPGMEAISVISMRRASRRERAFHAKG